MSFNPFEELSAAAQQVLTDSYQILMEQHQSQLETEHLLLALVRQKEGLLTHILGQLKIDLDSFKQAVQSKVEALPKLQAPTVTPYHRSMAVSMYITPRLQRVFTQAKEESERLKSVQLDTAHLLLAMPADPNDPVAALLKSFGLTKERVLQALPETIAITASDSLAPQPDAKDDEKQPKIEQSQADQGWEAKVGQLKFQLLDAMLWATKQEPEKLNGGLLVNLAVTYTKLFGPLVK